MAKLKHFADTENGTVLLDNVQFYGKEGYVGFHPDTRQKITASRKILFKSQPSKHTCDARCIHAIGKNMSCECACGGANHGRGY